MSSIGEKVVCGKHNIEYVFGHLNNGLQYNRCPMCALEDRVSDLQEEIYDRADVIVARNIHIDKLEKEIDNLNSFIMDIEGRS